MRERVETVVVDAPPQRVWAALTDWTRQGEWMLLTDVELTGGDQHGVGGRVGARPRPPLGGRRPGGLDTNVDTEWGPPRGARGPHPRPVGGGPGRFGISPPGA